MVFGWRRKSATTGKNAHKKLQVGKFDCNREVVIPNHFLCPISLDLMKDPVTLSSGITYDRESIETWLEEGNFKCPVTNQVLSSFDQIPNHTLRRMIQDWCVQNRNYGVDRIPTPRVPVSDIQVSEVLYCLEASAKRLDGCRCLELMQEIKKWGGESERNRRCIRANGAGSVLAAAFNAFARDNCFERDAILVEEILAVMNWMFPFDVETQSYLGTQDSLRCMVWFLKCRDQLSAKRHSLIALKELLSSNQQHVDSLAAIEGVNEVLFKFIQHPICPTITKSSLAILFSQVSSPSSTGNTIKSVLIKMGLVPLLLEVVIDPEKSTSEKALGVLDRLLDSEEGIKEAYGNALTIPILVKKILRVSELATKDLVSAILKLTKYEEKVLVDALQVGAFQKLVLVLQVGCGDETKEKATELLKMMNPYRAGFECTESVDFKNLKRSF